MWKVIKDAPRDGTVLILGHVNCRYVEYHGRWGIHNQTGIECWVDGHGNKLFDATHFDYPMVPPKKVGPADNSSLGVSKKTDPWHVEHDANGDPYSIFDRIMIKEYNDGA
jgi:hypothetical protein